MDTPTAMIQSKGNSDYPGDCVIRVAGVGGCGCNVLRHMATCGFEGATLIAINTDAQALSLFKADQAVHLDFRMGPASHPMYGQRAAEENFEAVKDAVSGTHLLFIVVGMGGSTGTGAAPVIARAARDTGTPYVVGIVTSPLLFEGKKRMETAEAGMAALQQHVDCLIVLPNEHVYQTASKKVTFGEVLKQVDAAITAVVECICSMYTQSGVVNVATAKVAAALKQSGMDVTCEGVKLCYRVLLK